MPSRNPEDLTTEMQALYAMFEQDMRAAGLKYILTCTYRSQFEQDALYAQGRLGIEEVNRLRLKAGLHGITPSENKIITKAKHSRHTDREAFDIAMLDHDGKINWKVIAYKVAGKIGKNLGLRWGGDFNSIKDYPHFEYAGSLDKGVLGA